MEPGRNLGPYEIVEQLGAGGMGEVWLAEDTRLGRKVAIKILPAEYAGDPDRLARFEREARAAAALNHPHIAPVFDVGHEDGVHFMVQEHLEGRTLREAIAEGRMPLKTGLKLGLEIAEGLGAAHAEGIVHRDLKPDNVFVTPDGHAKILDFGLAKLTEVAAPSGGSASMSPTVLGTMAGQMMGTAGYMAPEQVDGAGVDQRADIFAFGCVLYELATGQQAFRGKNLVETLHRVSNSDPEGLVTVDGALPADLQRILDKALAKQAAERYQTAGDLAVDLRTLMGAVESGAAIPVARAGASSGGGPSRVAVAVIAVGALLVGAGAGVVLTPPIQQPMPVTHLEFDMVKDGTFTSGDTRPLSISADGDWVAFGDEGQVRLRQLSELGLKAVRGATAPRTPVFSPDGEWIAFATGSALVKVPREGGATVSLAEIAGLRGLSWTDDGDLLAATDAGILSVQEDGAGTEVVIAAESAEVFQGPSRLPGGDWILFSRLDQSTSGNWSDAQVIVHSLGSGERRVLISGGVEPRYVDTGHLVFAREGSLMAVPFDIADVEVRGSPTQVMDDVAMAPAGGAYYDLSPLGHLVYFRGLSGEGGLSLAWYGLDGSVEVLPFEPAAFDDPALASDGNRIAVAVSADLDAAIWIYELDRQVGQRLTPPGLLADSPVWSPDGEWVYFRDQAQGVVARIRADFTGVMEGSIEGLPHDISADGSLLGVNLPGTTSIGVFELPGGEPKVIVQSDAVTLFPRFSPGGDQIAYSSQESGTLQTYVRELESGRRHVVSPSMGLRPMWSADGKTLYYIGGGGQNRLFAVPVTREPELRFGTPVLLGDLPLYGYPRNDIVVAPEGDRFLFVTLDGMTSDGEVAERGKIQVIRNWGEVLREQVPTSR